MRSSSRPNSGRRRAREIEMRGPGILGGGVAAYQQHDQLDQALVELGADAKTICHGVGGLSDVRTVNPDRERTAELAARPGAHDLVIERLLAHAELVAFHLFDAAHSCSPVGDSDAAPAGAAFKAMIARSAQDF